MVRGRRWRRRPRVSSLDPFERPGQNQLGSFVSSRKRLTYAYDLGIWDGWSFVENVTEGFAIRLR